jgi:hypothetical protein
MTDALIALKVYATDVRSKLLQFTAVINSLAYSTDLAQEPPAQRSETPPLGPRVDNLVDDLFADPKFELKQYTPAHLSKRPPRRQLAVPPSFSPLVGNRGWNLPVTHPTLAREITYRELRDLLIRNNRVVRVARHIFADLEGPHYNMLKCPLYIL